MYKLINTFSNTVISKHRTLEAAAKADVRHDRAVKRTNGSSSYIPTVPRTISPVATLVASALEVPWAREFVLGYLTRAYAAAGTQTALAAELGVNLRTVQRWFADPALRAEITPCDHANSDRVHISGRGRNALYRHVCPDCGYAETEGYEGDE